MGQFALYLLAGTALTLLLQTTAGLLGPVGFLINMLTPLPAAYAVLRIGPTAGGGIVFLATVVPLVLGNPAAAAGYFLQFGLGSLVLGVLLRRGGRWDRAVALALGVTAGASALTAMVFSAFRGAPLTEVVGSYIQGEVDQALAIYREAEMSPEQMAELSRLVQMLGDFLIQAWPGLAVVVTGTVLTLTVLFLSALSRGTYEIPGPSFNSWKAPEHLVWFLIAGGCGLLLTSGLLHRLSLNVITVVLPIYFLQGLSIVTWFFRKKNVPPFFRNLGYMLVVFFNPLPIIITAVGIFDLWIDFRKSGIKNN